jgi:hypothetical protein
MALAVPFLVLLFALIVQVALVAKDQVLVVHAAREAARAAAVDPSARSVRAAAKAASPLRPDRLDVQLITEGRDRARVSVTYAAPTDLPLVGRLVGDVIVRATATMRIER